MKAPEWAIYRGRLLVVGKSRFVLDRLTAYEEEDGYVHLSYGGAYHKLCVLSHDSHQEGVKRAKDIVEALDIHFTK